MKNNNKSIDWGLLGKYISGDCGKDEETKVMSWINSNQDNYQIFEELKKDQEKFNNYKEMRKVNVDAAWEKMTRRIGVEEESKVIPLNPVVRKKNMFVPILRIAAAIVLIAGVYFTIDYIKQPKIEEGFALHQAGTESVETILPDGSKVNIYYAGNIRYRENFSESIRLV